MDETVLDLGLENIDGLGPKTKEKLIAGGIDSIMGLAVALPSEVEEILGGEETTTKLIFSARQYLESKNLLEKQFILASDFLQKRQEMMKVTTGSTNLDELLLGGVETQSLTEFYGDFGSGKTQICHTFCVT